MEGAAEPSPDLPRPLRGFRSGLRLLGRAELALTVLALLAIAGLNAAGVVLRYGFNSSIVWSEEISLLLTNAMVFAGAAAMYKARAYVVLDVVFRRLPPRAQQVLTLAAWALAAAFAALVCWQAVGLYPLQIRTRSYILELPRFYATIPLIYGAASIALTSLYHAGVALQHLRADADPYALETRTTILPGAGPV